MREDKRRVLARSVALCAAVLLAAVAGELGADPDLPVIEVRFESEAPLFEALGEDDWAAIGAAAASKVRVAAGGYWGFLDWEPDPDAEPAAVWIVKLEEAKQDLTVGDDVFTDSVIRLRHYGEVGGDRYYFQQSDDKEILYDWGSLKPTQQPDSLQLDITRRLDRQLETLVRDWKVEGFTELIPISDSMIADSANRRLLVPLRMQELRAKPTSVLNVILVVQDADEARLELVAADSVDDEGPHKDFVRGKIQDFVLEDEILPFEEDPWWQERLAELIAVAPDVKVYMLVYDPSLASTPTTTEGVVMDPDI